MRDRTPEKEDFSRGVDGGSLHNGKAQFTEVTGDAGDGDAWHDTFPRSCQDPEISHSEASQVCYETTLSCCSPHCHQAQYTRLNYSHTRWDISFSIM